MSVIESIIRDLKGLPNAKLVEVARYIHGLSEEAQKERLASLHKTFGVLGEEDGRAFEEALAGSRRLEQ
jgi:hypothetical protein